MAIFSSFSSRSQRPETREKASWRRRRGRQRQQGWRTHTPPKSSGKKCKFRLIPMRTNAADADKRNVQVPSGPSRVHRRPLPSPTTTEEMRAALQIPPAATGKRSILIMKHLFIFNNFIPTHHTSRLKTTHHKVALLVFNINLNISFLPTAVCLDLYTNTKKIINVTRMVILHALEFSLTSSKRRAHYSKV